MHGSVSVQTGSKGTTPAATPQTFGVEPPGQGQGQEGVAPSQMDRNRYLIKQTSPTWLPAVSREVSRDNTNPNQNQGGEGHGQGRR